MCRPATESFRSGLPDSGSYADRWDVVVPVPPRSRRSPGEPKRLVVIELGSAEAVAQHHKEHLNHGGAMGPPGGQDKEVVSLLIAGPAGIPLELLARTVFCSPVGTGYELLNFGPDLKTQIDAWVADNVAPEAFDAAPTLVIPGRITRPSSTSLQAEAKAAVARAVARDRADVVNRDEDRDDAEAGEPVPHNVLEHRT